MFGCYQQEGAPERNGTEESVRIRSCERLNVGGCLITRQSWGAAYLLLGYISAVAAEVGIEGQHLHAHSQWGLQQTTRSRLLCSASVVWLNIALQNTVPARC